MTTPRITDVPNQYEASTFRSIMRDIYRIFERLGGDITTLMTRTQVSRGMVTLNGATAVPVANTAVTADSQISLTFKTLGGTRGAFPLITPTAGVGFSVAGTALDTSVYNYEIR